MSATTENYGLHQWEPEDDFLRTDFNEDNAKIDAALGTIAATAGNCNIAYGTYTGNGTFGKANPTGLDFANTLGKAPKLLLVRGLNGSCEYLLVLNGMASTCLTSLDTSGSGTIYLTWTNTGVTWYSTYNANNQLNRTDTYFYVALA